jgi:hypothetical protein
LDGAVKRAPFELKLTAIMIRALCDRAWSMVRESAEQRRARDVVMLAKIAGKLSMKARKPRVYQINDASSAIAWSLILDLPDSWWKMPHSTMAGLERRSEALRKWKTASAIELLGELVDA